MEENMRLRKLLWLHHGCDGLYGDDGEMQCNRCGIDFKRHSIDYIEARFEDIGKIKLIMSSLPPNSTPESLD